MGRSFLPPAPNICAAAASMGGPPRLAASACKFVFIISISADTGCLMAWIVTGALLGELPFCAVLCSASPVDVALSTESCEQKNVMVRIAVEVREPYAKRVTFRRAT